MNSSQRFLEIVQNFSLFCMSALEFNLDVYQFSCIPSELQTHQMLIEEDKSALY